MPHQRKSPTSAGPSPTSTVASSGSRRALREQAILDASLELLAELGYERFSMDALAERARASKATIYRRWSGKAELVADAVRHRQHTTEQPLPDTGALRSDLLAFVRLTCTATTQEDGAMVVGVLNAMSKDPDLATLVREQIIEAKLARTQELVGRAVARGDLAADADLTALNEVLFAVIFMRACVTGEPIDESFALHLVDDVILPLLCRRQFRVAAPRDTSRSLDDG